MTALLDLPAIRERVARSSVEDYHWLGELPMELLRGTIIEKMSKSPSHQFYTDRLRKILSAQISPEWIARQGGPLTFADSEPEPEPDVAVVRGPEESYRTTHPTTAALVVEIAVSSLEIDRVKAQIYAEAGVLECWNTGSSAPRKSRPKYITAPARRATPSTKSSRLRPRWSVGPWQGYAWILPRSLISKAGGLPSDG